MASSSSFKSHNSERPPSLAPVHHSVPYVTSRASTAHSSISSQDTEQGPSFGALPTFTTAINDRGETELKYHGEQIWEPPQSHASGGQRTESKHQRGCVMPRAKIDDQARWKRRVQDILCYEFQDCDLLEEALESPGSGVTVVGKTHRHFLDGNRGLAKVGEAVMTLVLRDQCYLYYVHEKDAIKNVNRLSSNDNLYHIGMTTKLQQYIRPRAPIRPTQSRSILGQIQHEVKGLGSDPVRTIANAVRAVIGAVYFDRGYESARRVMAHLGLIIKVPDFGHMRKYAKVKEEGAT